MPQITTTGAGTIPASERTGYSHDPLGRVLTATAADGALSTTEYTHTSIAAGGHAGFAHPTVVTQDAHCTDNNAATLCGEVRISSDARGNGIRREQTDVNSTDVAATGTARITSYGFDLANRLTGVTDPAGATWAYTYDVFGNRLTANDPDLGAWTMVYDANNRLTLQTDAKGQTIAFTYDALNRVLTKTVAEAGGLNPVVTTSTYDQPGTGEHNTGQLTTLANPAHTIRYGYDESGNPTRTEHVIDGRTYALETSFHASGALLDQKLPDSPGATTTSWSGTYAYDTAGRITGFGSQITAIDYNIASLPTRVAFASGVEELRSYDAARLWLTDIHLQGGSATTLDRTTYTRTATGRLSRQDSFRDETDFDYSYDYAGRLLSSVNFSAQTLWDQSFTYDAAGNMRSNSHLGSYAYNAPGGAHPHAPVSVGSDTFTYDANGNMTTGLHGKVMSYDAENRPLSVTLAGQTTSYIYGADGSRLKRLSPGGDVTVTFGPVEIRKFGQAGEVVLTYPHPDVRLTHDGTGTEVHALHRDQLASVRTITDSAGAVASGTVYHPFGQPHEWASSVGLEDETKAFIGERYDSDPGLLYLNARYMDPELAMFIQPDWWEVTKAGVGTNRYSYSFNDPVNLRDPGGNCVWDVCIGEFIAGLALVFATDAAIDIANGGEVGDSPLGNPTGVLMDDLGNIVGGGYHTGAPIETNPQDLNPTSTGGGASGEWGTGGTIYTTPIPGQTGPIILSTPVPDGEITITYSRTGSYTIDFPDGTRYHGKGPIERARRSARQKARQHEYDIGATDIDWAPAENDREAFKDEDDRIQADGGVENPGNHNAINSPGRRYNDQDRDR